MTPAIDITDLVTLLPLLAVAGGAVLVLLGIVVHRNAGLSLFLTLVSLVTAWVLIPVAGTYAPRRVTGLVVIDRYGLFFWGLIVAAALVVAILSHTYLQLRRERREELDALLLLATVGAMVLAVSSHFASLFLGLETLSVSLYGLAGYLKEERASVEAAVKYLILAGASSAVLLFGIGLLYADTGTLLFGRLAAILARPRPWAMVDVAGLTLVIAGLGFKLALVPFHMWTPDVYAGAPAPVTAFVATASKAGVFAVLLRYFVLTGHATYPQVVSVLGVLAIASMVVGNVLALLQDDIKRILAYSSIAHLGYLLVAFLAAGPLAVTAVLYYFTAYFITTMTAFGVITVRSGDTADAQSIASYRGLFWRRPALAVLMTASLLSLAGIPLTAGFVGKFYVLAAGVSASLWLLVVVLVLSSVIGLFYYLRVVVAMFSAVPSEVAAEPVTGWARGTVLTVLFVGLLGLGVYPAPLQYLIHLSLGG